MNLSLQLTNFFKKKKARANNKFLKNSFFPDSVQYFRRLKMSIVSLLIESLLFVYFVIKIHYLDRCCYIT